MKKLFVILLAIMMLFSFAACGSGSTEKENESKEEEKTSLSEEIIDSKENVFTEKTVLDDDTCSIKITGIDPDAKFGYSLKVDFENKSDDKRLTFYVIDASINGVTCDANICSTEFDSDKNTELNSGHKASGYVTFSEDVLKENGIIDYTDIEISFGAYDTDNFIIRDCYSKYNTVRIYPYGQNEASKYIREAKSTDKVIIDNDYYSVTVTGYDTGANHSVELFVENRSDYEIEFNVYDASVNGCKTDSSIQLRLPYKKCGFCSIIFSDADFEAKVIDKAETIKFNLQSYDCDSYNRIADDSITLNP